MWLDVIDCFVVVSVNICCNYSGCCIVFVIGLVVYTGGTMKMEKKRFTYNSSDNIIEEDGEFLAYLTESNVHCILGRLEELYNVNEGMRDYIEHNREVCLELLEEQGKSKVSWFEWILEHLFEIFLVEVFIMLQFIIICFLLSLFGVI